MNKQIIILLSLGIVAFCEGKELSDLLQDEKFVENVKNCILDKETCDDMGFKVRNVLLPELISRDCESCSPSLKKDGQTLLALLKERYSTEWIIISHMYDQEIYDIPGYYTTPLMPPL
ncbi:uncharacterized protein LOC116842585 [Odontomachus brunneus]|uniref:uncharacterized protein LOC116842585 n=1 Tax=Odontomachus brunneus TaxID=486640 RepID=UPI0013F1A70E|nr:uncharacterized protein LOC116842585 [Odontomachus brunneus]